MRRNHEGTDSVMKATGRTCHSRATSRNSRGKKEETILTKKRTELCLIINIYSKTTYLKSQNYVSILKKNVQIVKQCKSKIPQKLLNVKTNKRVDIKKKTEIIIIGDIM